MNIDFYNSSIDLRSNYLDTSHILIAGEFKRGKNIELIFNQSQFDQTYGTYGYRDYILCRDIILPQVNRISILRALNPILTDMIYDDMILDINYTTSSFQMVKIQESNSLEVEHIITLDNDSIERENTITLNTFLNNNIITNNLYKNDNLYNLLLFKQDLTMIFNQKNININKYLIFDSNYNHSDMLDYYLYSSNTESINDEHSIYFKQYLEEFDEYLDLDDTCQIQYLQRNSLVASNGITNIDATNEIGISGLTGLTENNTYRLTISNSSTKIIINLFDITNTSNGDGQNIYYKTINLPFTTPFFNISNDYLNGYLYFDYLSGITSLDLIFTVKMFNWSIIDKRVQQVIIEESDIYTNNLIGGDLESELKFSSHNFYGKCYWMYDTMDIGFRQRWLTQVQNKSDNILLVCSLTPGDWGNNIQIEIKGSNIIDDSDKGIIVDDLTDDQILVLVYYDDSVVEYHIIDNLINLNDLDSNYVSFNYLDKISITNSSIHYKFSLINGRDGIIEKSNYTDIYRYYMNEEYTIILMDNKFIQNSEIYNEIINKKNELDLHCTILIQKDSDINPSQFKVGINSDDDVFIFTDSFSVSEYEYPRYFLLISLMNNIINNRFNHFKYQKHLGGYTHISSNNDISNLINNNINYFNIDVLVSDNNMNNTSIVLANSILINRVYNDLKILVDGGLFNTNNIIKIIEDYINLLDGFDFITVVYDSEEDVYIIEYRFIYGIRNITMKLYRS